MEKKKNIGRILSENLVIIGIIILIIVTSIIQPLFLGQANLTNVMRQLWPLPFTALGMTFVVIAGFVDLSIPGIMGLDAVIVALLIPVLGQVGAILVGIVAGAMMGYINGLILTAAGARISAENLFICYGMSQVYTAIALILTQAETIRIERLGVPVTVFTALGSGTVFGVIPLVLVVFIVILLLMDFFQRRSLTGRSISILGGNREAAFLAGFNDKRTVRIVYMISGLFAGLGAISLVARTGIANSGCGVGFETNSILCVVVGGTSLSGGKGSVLRSMIGVLLVTLLGNCMNMMGLSTYMQTVMRGAVLVIAIWLDNRKQL